MPKPLHRAAAYAIFALLAAGCSSPTMSPRDNEFSKIERGASQNSSAHGTFKVIYTFNESDGYNPNGLIVDDLGDILGTTQGGGPDFAGVVFELRTRGGTYVERTLFSCNGQDCGYPYSTPYEDANGDLFITSWMSGRDRKGERRQGSLIELSPEGRGHYRKSVVSRLSGHLGDGSVAAVLPQGSLLYAAAFVGGKYASGAIVAFTGPRLQESNVYSFRGNAKGDASNPNSNLVADASGAVSCRNGSIREASWAPVSRLTPLRIGSFRLVIVPVVCSPPAPEGTAPLTPMFHQQTIVRPPPNQRDDRALRSLRRASRVSS